MLQSSCWRQRQALFIDGGTTNIAIARAIPQDLELTVATNCVGVASALSEHGLVDLIILGGSFDRELGVCVGGDTLRAVAQLSADLFFLGSCGVDASRGATAFNSTEAEVKRAMASNSAGIVIAATTDKLATAAPFRVGGSRRSGTSSSTGPRRPWFSRSSRSKERRSILRDGLLLVAALHVTASPRR